MAVLIDVRQVREDEREVEYVFGYPKTDRRMVIRKETGQASAVDGNEDGDFAAVFVKLLRFWRREGVWPETGSYTA